MERPEFLQQANADETGAAMIIRFALLNREQAQAVDQWLLWASCYGSMTWQERCLLKWIENNDFDFGN